jgi:fluoride exporter
VPDDPKHRRFGRLLGADDPLPIDPDLAPDDVAEPSATHRAGPHVHRAHPAILAAVVVGGFVGTLARYAVDQAWPPAADHFPTATFVINTSGAFALGLVLTVILERLGPSRYRLLRPFAATGVLGGWTTYSTLVVDTTTLGKAGDVALAGGYLAATLVCGVTAVTLGIAPGRRWATTPLPPAQSARPATEEAG